MRHFHHHPDGLIIIENDSGARYLASSVIDFQIDLKRAKLPSYPGLPTGQRSEFYSPELHAGFTRDSQHAPSLNPKLLTQYIESVDRLKEAQSINPGG